MSELAEADLALVKWVAESRIGDALPEEFQGLQPNGTGPLIQRLVDAGVVHSVHAGQPIEQAAVAAQADCREWLEAHG